MSEQVLIIGGSHAGVAVASNLRKDGFDGGITMLCAEKALPYQRPPLSKAYMAGDMDLDRLHLRPAQWYADNDVVLKLGVTAVNLDTAAQTVRADDGQQYGYDHLVLATGASPRTLPENVGGTLQNVHVMRDLHDADTLMDKMREGADLVVIGGGYIGLEAAAEAAKKGLEVTVIEAAPRILQRVACAETADVFRRLHQEHGVTILEETQLVSIDDDGKGACKSVTLIDGREIPADIVIVGIGVAPNTALAANAGLPIDIGIKVDEFARTSVDNIYACGDCAILPFGGMPTRLESVQNANDQGAIVAANIMGQNKSYEPQPWFWSDQYDMKLQIAGLNRGYDRIVVREGKREGSISHFYFAGDRFLAVDCLNDGATYAMAKRILAANIALTPAQAEDQEFSLKSLL